MCEMKYGSVYVCVCVFVWMCVCVCVCGCSVRELWVEQTCYQKLGFSSLYSFFKKSNLLS